MTTVYAAEGTRLRTRVRIGELYVDKADLTEALARCERAIRLREPLHVVTANLQFLSMARKDFAFRDVVNDAGLVVADGMPVVWLSRLFRGRVPMRITGHDLTHHLATLAAERGYSVFLLGGGPGSGEKAGRRLMEKYPGLRIAGSYRGHFDGYGHPASEEEQYRLDDVLRAAKSDILLAALGCPKQEFWIARHGYETGIPVMAGVGSVIDTLAGKVQRAPGWMQRSGLEWAFRLGMEPRRLWKRYLLSDLPTIVRLTVMGLAAAAMHRKTIRTERDPVAF